MPKYRTKKRTKAAARIQRVYRKYRRGRTRIRGKPLALKQHNFVERKVRQLLTLNNTTLDSNGNLSSTNTWSFQMSDIPQIASYQSLFEYYRLNKVVVDIAYKNSGNVSAQSASLGAPINEINPTLYFKVDHNDVVGDNMNTLLESMKTHKKQLTNARPHFSLQLKPAIQTEAYKSAIASTYIPKWGQWLSFADPTVPHYGLKLQVQTPTPSSSIDFGSLEVTMKYYFSTKNNE